MIRVEHDDMLQAIPRVVAEGVVCDAVVTDPPYNLAAMAKRFGPGQKAATSPDHQRFAKGFMGMTWDSDVAFRAETWATVATVLRPGAFVVAFGGTRTHHRLACAIEDAGFVIQDTIAWLFASGFPKRRDMLKPAFESIVVAQKPIQLRSAVCELQSSLVQMATLPCGPATIIALSTVSLWLDTLDALSTAANTSTIGMASRTIIDWKTLRSCLSAITPESIIQAHSQGHLSIANASPAIRFFDAEVSRLRRIPPPSAAELAISRLPIERLGEAALGIEPLVLAYKPGGKRTMQVDECRIEFASEDDQAAAAAAAAAQRLCHDEPGRTYGGLGKTGFTRPRESLAPYLANLHKGRWPANVCHDGSDEVVDAFPDSAGQLYGKMGDPYPHEPREDAGSAARFFFSAKADADDRWGSRHPTVKPIDLIAWLVALVTPAGGLFLDPFAGSGTAAAAALKTGRNAILIERESQYVVDIRERIAFYEGEGKHSLASKARRSADKPLGGLFA